MIKKIYFAMAVSLKAMIIGILWWFWLFSVNLGEDRNRKPGQASGVVFLCGLGLILPMIFMSLCLFFRSSPVEALLLGAFIYLVWGLFANSLFRSEYGSSFLPESVPS